MRNLLFQKFVIVLLALSFISSSSEETLYKINKGEVKFISEAPLELIEGQSDELAGIISSENQTFAFSINIRSFLGFNSPLQREHFNENYLESDQYEKAIFTGVIIEDVDFSTYGLSLVRAKGKLNIHGVENVTIIEVQLDIREDQIEIASEFSILLEDYNISIPRIVNKKIAETIKISVNATLEEK